METYRLIMCGTRDSGYQTKQYYAAYQSIQLDEPGTDCGSKVCLELVLTEDIMEKYYYQYIVNPNGKGYTMLSPDNKDQFKDKKVKIRTPMGCPHDKTCNICAGERFYIMKIENAGLTTGRITNTLLEKSMKNFHNAKQVYDHVNIDDLLV